MKGARGGNRALCVLAAGLVCVAAWRRDAEGAKGAGDAGGPVGAGSKRLRLEAAPGMTRAELFWVETVGRPRGVLVVSPGFSASGEAWIQRREWREFAERTRLGLVGLSFASTVEAVRSGEGYYYAAKGSGDTLLGGLREIYGKDLPLCLYGLSGGAHFTARFAEWKPERVLVWSAYSAGWWDDPRGGGKGPPGLVACGLDDPRLGASLGYFKQGRAAGRRWLWLGVGGTGHWPDPRAEAFVRRYFEAVLAEERGRGGGGGGIWVDVDTEALVGGRAVRETPSLTGWLPDGDLLIEWRSINDP